MSKQIVKIILDGKSIGTKPLFENDSLTTIREKIQDKTKEYSDYIFIDKNGDNISKENEKDYNLQNICESKTIKIKSLETSNSGINVLLNDSKKFSINCSKSKYLNEVRGLINNNIQEDFLFLDQDGYTISKTDENDYTVEDILNNESIKIQANNSTTKKPSEEPKKVNDNNVNNKNLNKKEIDSSKLISIYLDGNNFAIKKLKLSDTLNIIRKNIGDKISESILFTLENGEKINILDESGLTLEDILIENKKINMISNKDSQIIKNTPLPNSKLIEQIGKLKIYKYPEVTLNDIEESTAISLLVVGQTGSGKTTLLNAFINALMNIQITDDFRYKIIIENFNHSQAFSMTNSVNIYNIKPHGNNPAIKIIDTPGFGNTRGIKQDKIIRDQIADMFKNKLKTINAICFVAQSSNARLTINQRYIFTSILDLFGKDVQENFVAMLTFCDGKEPQIVEALKEKDSIFDKIIPYIKGNWYYKFNNSAIYSDDIDDEFTQMFWKLGMKSFEGFISQLLKIPRKSLTQSKEVLRERQSIENSIKNLSDELQRGLTTMESIR